MLVELLLDCCARVKELLNILVERGQLVLLFVVFCNQTLLLLKQALTLLFQGLPFAMFVVDAGHHEIVFGCVVEVWVRSEKFINRDQRERLVFVTVEMSVNAIE